MSTRDAVARSTVTPPAAGRAAEPASDPASDQPAGPGPDRAARPPVFDAPAGTPPDPPIAASPTRAPGTGAPPALSDLGWTAATTAVKATIIALAADAFINSHKPRFQGKAMRVRALGYTSALLIVPLAWRLRGRREPYPRELDLLVALPLLADAGGNAIGMYQNAHVDDAIHFANGALLAGVVGAVVAPRDRTAWEAATFATAVSTAVAAGWEMFEWIGLKLGAKGMDLSYDDTMHDLIETTAGAFLGGLVTLLRHPARLRQVPGRSGDPIVRQPA